jgi:GT2 family glycosyltransferase
MVSVVVPTLNGGDKLRLCLEALAAADPAPGEIVIVNDGGSDDLTFARDSLGARIIDLEVTGGPARARNRGAAQASGDILFFVDADVVVSPDVVGIVTDSFSRDPGLSAIMGSYDDDPAETNFLSQYRNLLHHYVHQQAKQEASTFWGACGAIRRSDFESAGGFDENLYRIPSIEDIELGIRLTREGKRIRLVKSLQIKHLKRWTARSVIRTDFFQRAVPWSDLILRERGFLNDLNISVANRMSVALVIMAVLFLVASPVVPAVLPAAMVCLIIAIALNLPLYLFFARRRGALFALGCIPWHLLQFFQSGIAFLYAAATSRLRGKRPSTARGVPSKSLGPRSTPIPHEHGSTPAV